MTATVEIVCGDSSHGDLPWIVARYRRETRGAETGWVEDRTGLAGNVTWLDLAGDEPMPPGDVVVQDAPHDQGTIPARGRFVWRCNVCGYSLARRAEKVWPVLDTLAAHNVERVTLTGLAATLA